MVRSPAWRGRRSCWAVSPRAARAISAASVVSLLPPVRRTWVGEYRTVGAGAVDEHQGGAGVGAASDPVLRPAQASRGGGELAVLGQRAGGGIDDGEGVGGGVGVDVDQQLVGVCDNGCD